MSVAARLAESSAAGDTAAFSYELFLPDTLEGADLLCVSRGALTGSGRPRASRLAPRLLAERGHKHCSPPPPPSRLFSRSVPKIDRLAASEPLFIDVASGPSASASHAALRLAAHAKRFAGVASLVHVGTGRSGPSRAQAAALLDDALAAGVRSVFVDAPLEGEG